MKDLSTRFQARPPFGVRSDPKNDGETAGIRRFFPVFSASWLFLLLGAAFIPYAGIYDDEVIFANPWYLFNSREVTIGLFHRRIALMILSYLGTLKTLLYIPILTLFGPNVWSLRLPMVLIGAITVFIFFRLVQRTTGLASAVLGTFLLASDPSFVLTNTFDWGPVALEHFLLVTGAFFLVKFAQESGRWNLFCGFFLFGLALWNKAIFVWALAGLFCAAVAVLWPEIRRLFKPSTAALGCAAFLIGALPLVIYNFRQPNVTVRSSVHFETNTIPAKFGVLRATLDGSALFGFLPGLDDEPNPKAAATLRGRAAEWIGARTGKHRRDAMAYACGIGLLLVPWWWKSRAARFSVVFMCVAWLAMAVTHGAGASAHHAVLLWPFPQLFVATVLASLPWRSITLVAGSALVAINLLVLNQTIADFERNGAPRNFSDASFALSKELSDSGPPVITFDWGIVNMLAFSHRGRLALRTGDPPFLTDSPSQDERKSIDWTLSDREAILVTHVLGFENWTGVRPRLDRAAADRGLRRETIKIVPDSNGRPVFEIFRFIK